MKIHRNITLSVSFLFLVLLAQPLYAQLFLCRDASGRVNYTNIQGPNCRTLNIGGYTKTSFSSATGSSNSVSSRYRSSRAFQPGLYDEDIHRICSRHNMDSNLIKAVIRTESGFNRYAVSKKGAQGLMQLMPGTARELNVTNPFDPRANIDGGTRYLKQMLKIFNGNLSLALAAYNAGPTLVRKKNRIPKIPETVNYVRRVLKYYKGYKNNYAVNIPTQSVINIGELETN